MIRARSLHLALAALGAIVVGACGSSSAPPGAASGTGGTTAAGGATAASGPLWHRDVRPIVAEKCAMCHTAGGIAPFPLSSYADAFAHRAELAGSVSAKLMPPWPPNGACNTYDHDRSLSAEHITTIEQWVQTGSAEGDEAAYVAPHDSEKGMSRVDRTMGIAEPYVPHESPDHYHCFVLDWPDAQTTYVTGFGAEPGNAAIVHHAIAFLATPDIVPAIQKLDDAEPGPGYTCFGGIGDNKAGWIGGWAPGGLGSDFPAGTGIKVPVGSKVVLQVHYNTANTAPAPDQTKIVLKLDDHVEKEAAILKFTNVSWVAQHTMNIPANQSDVKQEYAVDPSPYWGLLAGGALQPGLPLTIYSAGLHMHTRGTSGSLRIDHADGSSDCALQIDNWSFHWQGSYGLRSPLSFHPGDKLHIECHFDNTAARQPLIQGVPGPVKDVNWGERTEDEMCLGLFYVTQ